MLRTVRLNALCIFFLFFAVAFASNVSAAGNKDFLLLKPDDCVSLEKGAVLQLPDSWHEYEGFIKICSLKTRNARVAKVSVIAIWVKDYYDSLPPGAPWEEFPLPLIVDRHFRPVGKLPELYPVHPPRELEVSYGKFQSGAPTEIRIHVHNPATSGDYDYAPLIWNRKHHVFERKKGVRERTAAEGMTDKTEEKR